MDACLADLHLRKLISFETGLERDVDPKEFERLIETGGSGSTTTTPATNTRGAGPRGPAGGSSSGGRNPTPPLGRGGRTG